MAQGRSSLAALLVSVATFLVSIVPIRSYDAFWHLAAGRWIAGHRALPLRDPFGLASDPVRWHDGEWLFQLLMYGVHAMGGEAALSIARALAVAALAGWLFHRARRESTPAAALLLVALAMIGADARLAVRPEIGGILLAAAVAALLLPPGNGARCAPLRASRIGAIAGLTIVWINIHPSALLAPLLVGAATAGRIAAGERRREDLARFGAATLLACLALLVNPWGWSGIVAPIRLAKLASARTFINTEWLPSDPALFPLLYASIAAGAALLAWRRRPALIPHALLFAIVAILAIRYVRNHGFFFALLPLLLAPAMPKRAPRAASAAALVLAALAAAALPAQRGLGTGADRDRFPVAATDQLLASGLRGNIYNPDQFGGYLIWRTYPERRVLTDGRNELYVAFLRELPRARSDSRRWARLLDRFDLALAVEEYRAGSIRVTDAATGRSAEIAPSRVYFPRARWALIGFDDVAMVFARRDAFDAETIEALEYRTLDPERGAVDRSDPLRADAELRRAAGSGAAGRRLNAMMGGAR